MGGIATSSFGTVEAFDGGLGLGSVRADDGELLDFHAVEIIGGGRTIEVGTRVVFHRLPRFGRVQAGRLRPL